MTIMQLLNSNKEAARLAAIVMLVIATVLEVLGSVIIPARMEHIEDLVSLISFAFVTLGGLEWVRSKVVSRSKAECYMGEELTQEVFDKKS